MKDLAAQLVNFPDSWKGKKKKNFKITENVTQTHATMNHQKLILKSKKHIHHCSSNKKKSMKNAAPEKAREQSSFANFL